MDTEHTAPAQGQSQVTLARVKALIARIDAERPSGRTQPANESRPSHAAASCLQGSDLAAWEAANSVVLPEAYRLFLLEIGNGGRMPGTYCDFELLPLDPSRADAKLQEPFPISRDRFEQRLAQVAAVGRGDDPLFPELGAYWEEGEVPPGSVPVGHYPSYDLVFLVVSGELHGMIWCAVDGEIPELDRQGKPFDFLSWFEDTLLDLTSD
jgi:hypothetical protein